MKHQSQGLLGLGKEQRSVTVSGTYISLGAAPGTSEPCDGSDRNKQVSWWWISFKGQVLKSMEKLMKGRLEREMLEQLNEVGSHLRVQFWKEYQCTKSRGK